MNLFAKRLVFALSIFMVSAAAEASVYFLLPSGLSINADSRGVVTGKPVDQINNTGTQCGGAYGIDALPSGQHMVFTLKGSQPFMTNIYTENGMLQPGDRLINVTEVITCDLFGLETMTVYSADID